MIFPLAPPTVTLDLRATTLTKALPEIGRAFGVPMRAAPAIGDELAVFALRGADLDGFQLWTARTFAAEWTVERDGTLLLNRSPKLRATESARLAAARVRKVAAWRALRRRTSALDAPFDARALRAEVLTHLAKPMPKEYDPAEFRARVGLQSRFPGERLYARVTDALPDAAFVAPPGPARVVYSSRPVGVQRKLPFDPAPILATYVREGNAWADATADLPPATTVHGGRIPTVFGRRQEPVGTPALLVVSVNFSDFGGGTGSMECALFDASGRRLVRQAGFVGDSSVLEDEPDTPRPKVEFPVTLTPESKAWIAVHLPEEGQIPTAEAFRPYLDVEARDPLSYGASDGLFALARHKNKSLVVRAVDDLAWIFRNKEDGKSSLNALSYFGANIQEDAAWMSVGPNDAEGHAVAALPRPALAAMLTLAHRTGLREIEDAGALMALFPDPAVSYDLFKLYGRVFPLWPTYGSDGLAIYGTLTDTERRAARTDAGLPLRALNPDARATLERLLLLRREMYPDPDLPAGPNGRDLAALGTMGEPTILLARGLPPEGRIRLRETTVAAIQFDEGKWQPTLTADEIALADERAKNPGRYPGEDTDPLAREDLIPVRQRRLDLEIRLTPLVVDRHNLTSVVRDPGGPVTRDTLPAIWQAAIDRAKAELARKLRDLPPAPPVTKDGVPPPR